MPKWLGKTQCQNWDPELHRRAATGRKVQGVVRCKWAKRRRYAWNPVGKEVSSALASAAWWRGSGGLAVGLVMARGQDCASGGQWLDSGTSGLGSLAGERGALSGSFQRAVPRKGATGK